MKTKAFANAAVTREAELLSLPAVQSRAIESARSLAACAVEGNKDKRAHEIHEQLTKVP